MPASAITAKFKPRCEDLRWVTASVLEALAARGIAKGGKFTADELREWIPQFKAEARVSNATSKLITLGFATHKPQLNLSTGITTHVYVLTARGQEALAAAKAGHAHKSGPKGPHSVDKTLSPKTFTHRLWTLMRMRKLLDAETAASVLVDAGDDVARAARTANKYLRRWVALGVLAESAQRVNAVGTSNGFKRYVLVNDCGPTPPAWTTTALARRAGNTSSQAKE